MEVPYVSPKSIGHYVEPLRRQAPPISKPASGLVATSAKVRRMFDIYKNWWPVDHTVLTTWKNVLRLLLDSL